MGEAFLTRQGMLYNENSPKLSWKLYTEILTENMTYTVPTCKNQKLTVLCFGGGGGCGNYNGSYGGNGGGGGGYMNKSIVEIPAGSAVPITIGSGGETGKAGGTTSFGGYLSANGGGIPTNFLCGGDGGSGGGTAVISNRANYKGGRGYNFGGGGIGLKMDYHQSTANMPNIALGAGGEYGGEGGYGIVSAAYYGGSVWGGFNSITSTHNTSTSKGGISGRLNTSNKYIFNLISNSKNGNTLTTSSSDIIYNGLFTPITTGLAGATKFKKDATNKFNGIAFGGGGGYGGCGGNGANGGNTTSGYCYWYAVAGGGGGGYGANGGNGYVKVVDNIGFGGAGGGGGYGSPGTDGTYVNNSYCVGGGGGGYGAGNFGRGSNYNLAALSGCIVIQYYGVVYE